MSDKNIHLFTKKIKYNNAHLVLLTVTNEWVNNNKRLYKSSNNMEEILRIAINRSKSKRYVRFMVTSDIIHSKFLILVCIIFICFIWCKFIRIVKLRISKKFCDFCLAYKFSFVFSISLLFSEKS